VLGVLAIVLLVIGSINPPVSSASARISRLDSIVKCPACEDLSIAQSNAPTSVTRIEQTIVDRYGQSGLLLPSASGLGALLYAVPLAAIGAAAVCLGWFFWRRQRRLAAVRAEVSS
jgi:cytochrome c-type biogenesis protein CcmH/NrfF